MTQTLRCASKPQQDKLLGTLVVSYVKTWSRIEDFDPAEGVQLLAKLLLTPGMFYAYVGVAGLEHNFCLFY